MCRLYPHDEQKSFANELNPQGQIFWAGALASPQISRVLSYWTGACTTLSWTFATAGCFVLAGKIVAASATILSATYEIQKYHVFLLAMASAGISLVFNTWLFKWVPKIAYFMAVFINLGTVYIFVSLLIRAHPKATASSVFTEVINNTGWSSDALVFCLNILPGSLSVCAFDTAAHMAEEIPQPERQVPKIMIYSALLSGVSGLVMAIVYSFCTIDPSALLDPIGGQPIFQLFVDALQSKPLVIVAAIIYCIVVVLGCIFFVTTLSRVVWSFSGHAGTPLGATLGFVHPRLGLPVHAVYAVTLAASLLCLLEFGPDLILNACFGAGGICAAVSFGIPICCLLLGGRQQLSASRPFSMGRFGAVVNFVAVIWQLFQVVFLAFPVYYPVTARNMNWALGVVIVGVICSALNWLFFARHFYKTPKPLSLERIQDRQMP